MQLVMLVAELLKNEDILHLLGDCAKARKERFSLLDFKHHGERGLGY